VINIAWGKNGGREPTADFVLAFSEGLLSRRDTGSDQWEVKLSKF
jgi:hypothetical protein